MKCLTTTGTKCLSFSYDSVANTCAFADSAKPALDRSFNGVFYEIGTFNFPQSGVTFSPGDCKWAAASDADWAKVAGCKSHTTRKACVSDSDCAYEYFTGSTYSESYFKVTGHAPTTATASETFTTVDSADDCAGWLTKYAGDATNTRLSYTYK